MRTLNNSLRLKSPIRCFINAIIIIIISWHPVLSEKVSKTLNFPDSGRTIDSGLRNMVAGSDSIFCNGSLLSNERYKIEYQKGRIIFDSSLSCDSLLITAIILPQWLSKPLGNPVPEGKKRITLKAEIERRPSLLPAKQQKITLKGNKSFSFSVGRSGQGQFSQGLNLDFDALLGGGVRARGSISDRIGSGTQLTSGEGSTTLLSELDKYFFEISGRKVTARGGDINSLHRQYLPQKKIKGIQASYHDTLLNVAADFGRPAGKFFSRRFFGSDGLQGPYQIYGSDRLPTAIVSGSEKIYLDGQLLDGGTDNYYLIDYARGRITFSPRVLITSRSRIEIDFEEAQAAYEQIIYDGAIDLNLSGNKLRFSFGARHEGDDQGQLRLGTLTPDDIALLQAAGDSSVNAFRDGVVSQPGGNYSRLFDSSGQEYYIYAGEGEGEYLVSFSNVGDGRGDYRYLGEGVFQYSGRNSGDYLPLKFLPLPEQNDHFFGALEFIPYSKGKVRLEYQGNYRDLNTRSSLDDGDNYKSQLMGSVRHSDSNYTGDLYVRFRQEKYNPVSRLNRPDNNREWSLGEDNITGDELRLEFNGNGRLKDNYFLTRLGYIAYKDYLQAHLARFEVRLLENLFLSPKAMYAIGRSRKIDSSSQKGVYEKLQLGSSLKPFRKLRFDFEYEKEKTEDHYDAKPDDEKYELFKTTAFWRNSVLSISRRTDYYDSGLAVTGPQLDKLELRSEEMFGRIKLNINGIWMEQKKLESGRDDRRERLLQASVRYSAPDGWLTLLAEYRQNRRTARSSSYRYLQVNSGEGDYRFEDGQYLTDVDGDFIRIREEAGSAASVSSGRKSHSLFFYPGRISSLNKYKNILSQLALRLRTEVTEDLPGRDRRRIGWLLPWTSYSGYYYLARKIREGYNIFLFPMNSFYILNFSYGNIFEEQEAGSILYRSRKEYETEIKHQLSPTMRVLVKWRHRRSNERGIGQLSMILRENSVSSGLAVSHPTIQVTPEITYFNFSEQLSGGKGIGVRFKAETVYREKGRGEIRFNLELQTLTEKLPFSQPEYLVTDGKRFGKSAFITLTGSYDIGKSLRLIVNLSDKIYEKRPAEFVGRGELIARF